MTDFKKQQIAGFKKTIRKITAILPKCSEPVQKELKEQIKRNEDVIKYILNNN